MKLKDSWNNIAKSWTKQWTTHMDQWQLDERMLFANYVENGLILDLGCGPGRDMKIFSKQGLDCIGLDFSTEMLKMVEEPSTCSNITDLPFRDNTFDGVWSCSAMKYLTREEMLTSLREIRRILKPDGVFWLGLDEGEGEKVEDRNGEEMKLHLYTEESILPLFKASGLKLFSKSRLVKWRNFLNFLLGKESRVWRVKKQDLDEDPLVSVVIHLRDRWGSRVRNCVRSLELQTHQPIEIIISDFGSSFENHKKLMETLEPFDCTVYYYPTDELWSSSVSGNIGIRRAKGKFIASIDVDAILEMNVIEKCLELFEERDKYFIGSIAWNLVNMNYEKDGLAKIQLPEDYPKLRKSCTGKTRVLGIFQIAPKWWWYKIQGKDERMKIWGASDIDMQHRARRSGMKAINLSHYNIRVFHQFHPGSKRCLPKIVGEELFEKHYQINKGIAKVDRTVVRNDENWGKWNEKEKL